MSFRTRPWVGAGVLVLAGLFAAGTAQAEHKYIGATKCGMCHKTEAKGNQLGQWQKSAHANAFATLAGEKALAVAKEKGLKVAPQEAPECLKCHVTGHGKAATAFDVSYKKEEGVSCEACHGPGSDYKDMKVMKDQAAAVAAGLVIPDEKTCKTCHNEQSPTFKGFVFKEAAAKIAHPNPAKAKS